MMFDIEDAKADLTAHPLDRNPAVLARAMEHIAELEAEVAKLQLEIRQTHQDIRDACGCDGGDDIRRHLAEYIIGE